MRTLDRLARRAARSPVLSTLTHPYPPGRLLELVDPLWSDRDRAEVESVRHETDDVVTLVLRPAAGWPGHRAGQHTVLRVEVDGVTHARAFTIASSTVCTAASNSGSSDSVGSAAKRRRPTSA